MLAHRAGGHLPRATNPAALLALLTKLLILFALLYVLPSDVNCQALQLARSKTKRADNGLAAFANFLRMAIGALRTSSTGYRGFQ